jgi:hypothetical protein
MSAVCTQIHDQVGWLIHPIEKLPIKGMTKDILMAVNLKFVVESQPVIAWKLQFTSD